MGACGGSGEGLEFACASERSRRELGRPAAKREDRGAASPSGVLPDKGVGRPVGGDNGLSVPARTGSSSDSELPDVLARSISRGGGGAGLLCIDDGA